MFRIIPKRKGSSKNLDVNSFKCEYPGCEISNVDLIKCILCSKWVCEDCNEGPVGKLKPIMNKCNTVYFICKGCDETNYESSKNQTGLVTEEETKLTTEDANNINAMKSFQEIFECKISQMESKLPMLIDDKLGQKIEVYRSLAKEWKRNIKLQIMPNTEVIYYSKTVTGSIDFRKIMREERK